MTGGTRILALRRSLVVSTLVATLALVIVGSARAAIQTFQIPTPGANLRSIVTGPDGNVYFTADQDAVGGGQDVFHVGELTTSGQLQWTPVPFGQSDTSGDHMGPTSITSSGGRLWFLSDVGDSLYTLAPGGSSVTLTTTFPLQDNGEQLAPAPGGGVWETTEPGGAIGLVDGNGDARFQSVNSDGPGTVFETPSGAAEYGNGGTSIDSIDASGNTASYPLPSSVGAGEVYAGAFDASGDLWYSTYDYSFETGGFDGAIGVLRPGASGGQTVVTMDPASGHGPFATDMVLGPDGAIYFTWTSTPDGVHTKVPSGIGRLNPATGEVRYFDTVQSDSLVPSALAFGADGDVYFLDQLDNLVGRVSPAALFPSAAPSGPTPVGPGHLAGAPTTRLSVPRQRLSAVRAHRRLTVRCALSGGGSCAVSAEVSAAIARRLHVKVPRRAKTVTIARASRTLTKRGTITIHLGLSRSLAGALRRTRSLTIELSATASVKGVKATHHATRRLTLSR